MHLSCVIVNWKQQGGTHISTRGAHKAHQDQGTEREGEAFHCIHEYHSSERGRRTKATEVNDFPVSSSVQPRFLCALVIVRFITRKTRRSTQDKGPYCTYRAALQPQSTEPVLTINQLSINKSSSYWTCVQYSCDWVLSTVLNWNTAEITGVSSEFNQIPVNPHNIHRPWTFQCTFKLPFKWCGEAQDIQLMGCTDVWVLYLIA